MALTVAQVETERGSLLEGWRHVADISSTGEVTRSQAVADMTATLRRSLERHGSAPCWLWLKQPVEVRIGLLGDEDALEGIGRREWVAVPDLDLTRETGEREAYELSRIRERRTAQVRERLDGASMSALMNLCRSASDDYTEAYTAMQEAAQARRAAIIAAHEGGARLQDIADALGLTRARVHAIINR